MDEGLFSSLFGEDEVKTVQKPTRPGIFSDDRIIKLVKLPPRSVLDTSAFGGEEASRPGAAKLLWRETPEGKIESNARFVEWEDGSWTMEVGSESFKIMERDEEVSIYTKNDAGDAMLLDGVLKKQMIITPSSLDSNAHRIVTRKTSEDRAVAAEKRRTHLTAQAPLTAMIAPSQPPPLPRTKRPATSLTADFLENDAMRTSSVKELKESFKRRAVQEKQGVKAKSGYSSQSEESSSDSDSSDSSDSSSDSSSS